MTDIPFDDLLKAAQKLTDTQKQQLILSLQDDFEDFEPTRAQLIAELEALRAAGAFDHSESLRGAFASPQLDALTDEQLRADIHAIATEWEKELDEFHSDDEH